MTTDIKELVKRLREVFVEDRGHGHTTEWTRNLDGHEAADALEALAGEVERLKRMLFPYAEDKEISGVTWNGFYLIGNKKSIDEFKRLENRAAQLETYRAEFVRRNEAAEAERDRLKEAIERNAQNCIDTMNKMHAQHAAERDRLAGEVEQACGREQRALLQRDCSTKEAEAWREERDRLKAALQAIEQGDYYGCVSEFALKALGGKE